ncbi:MAG: tetratricopeptide repeat protein [Candidatus Marinimicrobia bacterium]|nr:tetratricopeptide repeat protein [Candidatus Neomarinimicrobiota bacterium]
MDMGITYANEGQYELAIDAFREALKENPDYLGAMLGINKCYKLMDNYPRPDFSKLDYLPGASESEIHYTQAKQKIVNNDIKAAIIDFKKCLDIDPTHLKAQYNIGIAYHVSGEISSAITAYKHAIEQNSQNYLAWESLGIAQASKKEYTKAEFSFKRAIDKNPGLASAHHSLGILYQRRGVVSKAKKHFNLAVAMSPQNPLYKQHLAEILNN